MEAIGAAFCIGFILGCVFMMIMITISGGRK